MNQKYCKKNVNYKYKFDGRKCNSNQKWNNKCQCKCKNPKKLCVCEKDYIWDSATCSCENHKCLESITVSLVITCDEIIEETKKYFNK